MVKIRRGGELYPKLISVGQNKIEYYIIYPCNPLDYLDCWLWDPFIAKRKMLGTKGEEESTLFFDATSHSRADYT
jgi:hypothetical protein